MSQNRALGLVQRDSLFSNIKVNQVAVLNKTTACNSTNQVSSFQPWALLTNNRVGFQCTVASTFESLNTLADADVFTLAEGEPIVEVTGARAGIIRFLESGVYQIQVYLEIVHVNIEDATVYPFAMCLSPSTIVPTTLSNDQVAIILQPNYFPNSAQSTKIIEILKDEEYELFLYNDDTSVAINVNNVTVTINKLKSL